MATIMVICQRMSISFFSSDTLATERATGTPSKATGFSLLRGNLTLGRMPARLESLQTVEAGGDGVLGEYGRESLCFEENRRGYFGVIGECEEERMNDGEGKNQSLPPEGEAGDSQSRDIMGITGHFWDSFDNRQQFLVPQLKAPSVP